MSAFRFVHIVLTHGGREIDPLQRHAPSVARVSVLRGTGRGEQTAAPRTVYSSVPVLDGRAAPFFIFSKQTDRRPLAGSTCLPLHRMKPGVPRWLIARGTTAIPFALSKCEDVRVATDCAQQDQELSMAVGGGRSTALGFRVILARGELVARRRCARHAVANGIEKGPSNLFTNRWL